MKKRLFNAPEEHAAACSGRKPEAGRRKWQSLGPPKLGYFILTWLHIYAVTYYSYYLFFHLRHDYGFGNRENLSLRRPHRTDLYSGLLVWRQTPSEAVTLRH
jgi:hypothetical protein